MRTLLLSLTVLAGILPIGRTAAAGGDPVLVPNVDRYRVVEPLFEAVRVVLAQRGEQYSPAYLQGLSGAAFRFAGPCPCAPTCDGAMSTEDLLRLLGYEYETLSMCEPGMDPAKEIDRVVGRVKQELRAGRAAIVFHAFTNAEFDVVCGFDEERKEFLGYGSYCGGEQPARAPQGRAATCGNICPALGAIIVGRRTGRLQAREAELSALEEAVRHARSPRDCFLQQARGRALPWRLRQGTACYDAWISRFAAEPRRVPDASDRYPLSVFRSTHRAAAAFVRELAPKYPAAQAELLAAAGEFAAEADALDEIHDKLMAGWGGWKQPESAKASRAVELLSRAADHYAAGIDRIDEALGSIDPARRRRAHQPAVVERRGDCVRIKGTAPLRFGEGKDCTYLGAMAAALAVTRQPYSYGDLMGLSGLAFRTRWTNAETATGWCDSAAVGELPDEGKALQAATGWHYEVEWVEPQGRDNEALRRRLVREIDAGRPVLSYASTLDMGLVYGYEHGGRILLTRDYLRAEPEARLPLEKLAPMRMYAVKCQHAPPLSTALRDALRIAVTNWEREKHDGGLPGREYWYGRAALQAWARDLRACDTYEAATRAKLRSQHGFCYLTLVDARRAAVGFLRDWSTAVDGEAAARLREAAECYEGEVGLLKAAQGPERGASEWTPAERERAAAALEAASETEARGIALLEQALATMQ